MPRILTLRAVLLALVLMVLPIAASSRQRSKSVVESVLPPSLVRTASRREVRRFGYGGTLTIYGAPQGSITIEAWPQSQVEITAEIELRADTEEELARLARVNNFLLDQDANHIRLVTTGTHDRQFIRRVAKDFPKKLLALPWKIDYRIRVPMAIDLEINAGHGALHVAGVEGTVRVSATESNVRLAPAGGSLAVMVERGSVYIHITSRSWRGRGAEVSLAQGDMTIELPANFNADIDAQVLHTGRIENTYTALTPREDTPETPQRLRALAGTGGALLSFTVGTGTLRITQASNDSSQRKQ